MLNTIPLLTALLFAAVYPLCFWISRRDPLKNDFHKFHLGLPNCVGGVAILWLLIMDFPLLIKLTAVLWKAVFLFISHRYWKKGDINPRILSVTCVLGMFVFSLVMFHLVILRLPQPPLNGVEIFFMILSALLGGLMLCASFYAMNLGHWYLNVHGLPIWHLRRAVYVFWALTVGRLILDIYMLLAGKVFFRGEFISVPRFLGTLDGVFLSIAFFFGTVFPIAALWFVKGTLDVKSTQSATGILYVIVSAVLIGDMAYKYFLIRYGLGM